MSRLLRPSIGLIGQIVAILLLTMVIEFGVSTLLYERASQFAVRDDEARRLAEHLVIARRLIAEQPLSRRDDMAEDLTTERYALQWQQDLPPLQRIKQQGCRITVKASVQRNPNATLAQDIDRLTCASHRLNGTGKNACQMLDKRHVNLFGPRCTIGTLRHQV